MISATEQAVERARAATDEELLALTTVKPLKLSDAIRMGSQVTTQAYEWGDGDTACALSAAAIQAKAMGYI